MKQTLLLGTTPDRKNPKRVKFPLSPEDYFEDPFTLDIQGEKTDKHTVFDLENLHADGALPFVDGMFDEIHAYEILEHYGMQGDYKSFFHEFGEFHRVLKPGGIMAISVPMWDSPWSIGDPGHCRVFAKQSFAFLTEDHYDQISEERGSSCTDYRSLIKGWWKLLGVEETTDQLFMVMQTV
jgi:SAM-dependent methyltransferase